MCERPDFVLQHWPQRGKTEVERNFRKVTMTDEWRRGWSRLGCFLGPSGFLRIQGVWGWGKGSQCPQRNKLCGSPNPNTHTALPTASLSLKERSNFPHSMETQSKETCPGHLKKLVDGQALILWGLW